MCRDPCKRRSEAPWRSLYLVFTEREHSARRAVGPANQKWERNDGHTGPGKRLETRTEMLDDEYIVSKQRSMYRIIVSFWTVPDRQVRCDRVGSDDIDLALDQKLGRVFRQVRM